MGPWHLVGVLVWVCFLDGSMGVGWEMVGGGSFSSF
jgi:hypothetical protein